MKKNDIVKVVVLLVVLMFILQSFQFSGLDFGGGGGASASGDVTGLAVFNGTIRTYNSTLYLPSDTGQSILDGLEQMEGVLSVVSYPDGVVVQTETRDDVFPIAEHLRESNVSSIAIANVVIPQVIELDTGAGKLNVTTYGAIQIITEPILDANSQVTVSMVAVANSKRLIGYQSATILLDEGSVALDAYVSSLDSKVYTYSIPWESRNNISGVNGTYSRKDSIIFTTPLSVSQVIAKKALPFITYIDAGSAQVAPSFDNITQLQLSFKDTNYTLPPSTLVVQTDGTPDLPYSSKVSYSYTFTLMNDSEGFDGSYSFITDKEYQLNSTHTLNASFVSSGGKIISVRSVSLPS